jgi:acetoin utilization deacetylase AcuC-like enzyme
VSRPASSRQLHAWASDHFDVPLPDGHPFPIAKYSALRAQLVSEGVLAAAEVHASEPAPVPWLARVHEARYLERALGGGLDAAEVRRIGMPWSRELVLRARAALFGTVMAARAALVHGVAGNLAGGTHHAFRDRGEGYCLFNDVAVAIALLREEGRAARPLIVDLDVHQGNGTASIFAGDPSVFTFSIHGAGNYPALKETSSLDLELPDGTSDARYLETLSAHLPAAIDQHAPDFVFYQAGVDALAGDRFGRLALTHEGLAARDAQVFAAAEARALPIVITLGGGYGRPLDISVDAHANVWRAARKARDRRPIAHHTTGSYPAGEAADRG